MAFEFEKPAKFDFIAGQTVDVTLGTRVYTFSIASAPHEPVIRIATRMRNSEFKKELGRLTKGEKVRIQGPSGDFVLPKKFTQRIAMLAGGIGITPFLSIVSSATRENFPHRLYLFYSNTTIASAPFLKELEHIAAENSRFALIPTITDKVSTLWPYERGRVDGRMLTRHLGDLLSVRYYLAGPPGFVFAMRRILDEKGVDEDNIRTEEFSGYA